MQRLHHMILRIMRSTSGASAAEFALILPLLLALLTAAVDFGGLVYTRLQVGSATHAGASYAAAQGFNQNGISTAMAGATSITVTTPAPVQSCGCPSASTGITAAQCGTTCTSGGTAGKYVTVTASANHSLIFDWPGLSNPVTLTSTARVRIP